jgi:hypothetical protein
VEVFGGGKMIDAVMGELEWVGANTSKGWRIKHSSGGEKGLCGGGVKDCTMTIYTFVSNQIIT